MLHEGLPAVVAVALSIVLARAALGAAWSAPDTWLVGSWVHPDCLSNHWLLAWVADRLAGGEGILHNPDYYWPVGDSPVLAGNGAEGILYLPFHLALGWPAAVPAYVAFALTLSGLGGWALARAAGAGPWAALLALGLTTAPPYVVQELGAGRFTQGSTGWLLLFLAAWLGFLRRPSHPFAVLAALLLAITSFFYWYYGLFGVLAGAALALPHLRRLPWRPIGTFAIGFLLLIGPWLALFVQHWASIPGTAEVDAFPHPESALDAAQLEWPWTVDAGRHSGMAMPLPALIAGSIGAVVCTVRLAQPKRRRMALGLLLAATLLALLSLGPAFPGAPYTVVYGLAAPLRRFWWPIRHVVVVTALWGVFGAIALTVLRDALSSRGGPLVSAALALLVAATHPALLHDQGAPARIPLTPVALPPPVYPELSALPDGVLVEPPLAPEMAGTQQHLVHQRYHGKPLLSGHALWVDRVRPDDWDAFVAGNSFLAEMQRLERGEVDGTFRFDPADLETLRGDGVRWFTLNRAALPLRAKPLVTAYDALFDALFGEPVARGKGLAAWDAANWDGETAEVVVPEWRWPAGLPRGGPTRPLIAKRPRSRVFDRAPETYTDSAP